ncbi:MAG: DMT family transporter [Lachnospiraceae bacterium]|nr:DMT family transporter [Lachnospiraceae bacterium]MDE6982702.1 DMT family transporter [Lachnospiraceae bacterium]
MNSKNKTGRNSFLLILTAFIWGIAFVAQSTGGDALGPYTFNCIRCLIGGVVLLPVIKLLDALHLTKQKPETKKDKKNLLLGGIICGIALALASNLQQMGLYLGSSAGKAGFLTACYILIVPVLGIFLKKKCGFHIWMGILTALAGLYFLCIHGDFSLGFSDVLLLLCAFSFAVHILVIDHFTVLADGVRLSCIQFFVCGALSFIPMYFVDMGHSISGIYALGPALINPQAWISILYAGILSCGAAYTLQIVGQQGMNPTVASLLLSLESVFSVVAGWVILGESLSPRELLGCVLIFGAVVLAQIPKRK